ncbi:right-handed parallel beta-helix repeat-containing protein [Bacillus benzoevorans]|uniref:Nitrous oxidase accessory protein n=1 Tax=Bacillus benzoevorans TaxID=1456 RepID=A0A7X0HXC1_9BACI|nr:NosD domain-containing protein [Bacillus benzoevorans]MBB6447336.1 nitrous oxidase accessory protein [Bacillus benzoevorans]
MNRWGLLLGILFLILYAVPSNSHAEGTLQQQIDAVPSGGTILLKDQVYEETIVLSKPITVEGTAGTKIKACSKEPVIAITGQNVTLKNLQVENCSTVKATTAIAVSGEKHQLEDLQITANEFGIKLNGVSLSTITNIILTGKGKENGIDLWESSDNMISKAKIHRVQDGVYLEKSHRNKIIENDIQDSRYGIHLMFCDQTEVLGNLSKNNSTGIMIMGTKDTIVENNKLLENNKNVHAQGILLYDGINTRIINNQVSTNRVGIFVDHANGNFIEQNLWSENFIGMQMNQSHENTVRHNSFIGNVNDSQAVNSKGNTIEQNYWDQSLKLDQEGNGISIIPFASDPYFLALSSYNPEYQLFFHSPGMIVLQKLMKSDEKALLRDESPRMTPYVGIEQEENADTLLWILSFTMIMVGALFFIRGRRRVLS